MTEGTSITKEGWIPDYSGMTEEVNLALPAKHLWRIVRIGVTERYI
ncbi:MAG: hypothetical protein LBS26_01090 [Campylobacteraceae bacterium]|nr:hypothetical protein [Campylobacteraceae bacterium]